MRRHASPLSERAEGLEERMDAADCDPVQLRRTYRQFAVVNQLLAGWDRLFARRLRGPARAGMEAGGVATLLDVGCGGGDLVRRLAALALRDGLRLDITGIDPDDRALAYARSRATPPNVRFARNGVEDLVREGRSFDVVVSNHVLHHLPSAKVPDFLAATARLTRRLALHNDIRRAPLAVPAFAAFSLPFRGSFIAGDGLRSIRRAFTPAELGVLAPPGWHVVRSRPFRQLVVLDREPAG